MRHSLYFILLCIALTMVASCTHSSETKDDESSSAMADYQRARAYDQGWQMKIAEHYYKKAYQGFAQNAAQDWYHYTDAGYRWAYLRFRRGDTEGAMNVTTGLLHQAKENEDFPKKVEAALLMLMAEIQLQLHQYDEALLTGQKVYEAIEQKAENGNQSELDIAWACINISDIHHKTGDTKGAMAWLDRCAQAITLAKQEAGDSLTSEEWKGHVALKRAL